MPCFRTKRGIEIFYEYLPRQNKPVLVFVHGLAVDHNYWEDYVKAFESEYGILVYDLKGHGKSSAPKDRAEYAVQYYADELAELISFLGISNLFIIGHSLGGLIASEYMVRYEPKALGAVLLATPVSSKDVNWGFYYAAKAALLLPRHFYRLLHRHDSVLFFSRLLKIYIACLAHAKISPALNTVNNLKRYSRLKKLGINPLVVIADRDEMIHNGIASVYSNVSHIDDRHAMAFCKEEVIQLIKKYIQAEKR